MSYADTTVMRTYMRGVIDKACLHYAIVSRALSYQSDEQYNSVVQHNMGEFMIVSVT